MFISNHVPCIVGVEGIGDHTGSIWPGGSQGILRFKYFGRLGRVIAPCRSECVIILIVASATCSFRRSAGLRRGRGVDLPRFLKRHVGPQKAKSVFVATWRREGNRQLPKRVGMNELQ